MANPTLHPLSVNIVWKNNVARHILRYSLVFILMWMIFLKGVRTENRDCPSECSCDSNLVVNCSEKGLTKVPSDLPEWMQRLDLSTNQLRSLNFETTRLPFLMKMKLSKNLLTEIPTLGDMPHLTVLSLSHNEIQHLNLSALRNLINLQVLDMNNNSLVNITTESIPFKSNIQVLNLNANNIQSIEKGSLDNLPSLVELRLNRNHLSSFKKDVFKELKNLQLLELNRNNFTKIEGLSFHGLEGLTVLKLRRNYIRYLLDGAFWGLNNMSTLQLDNNNITRVTKAWLYGLKSLQLLTLSNNQISTIEKDGWEFCQQLIELDLSYNNLESIEEGTFRYLSKLQKLYLVNNEITYVAEGAFNNTPALEVLELSGNRISTTIEDMSGGFICLSRLLKLGLANNQIKSITRRAFAGLEKLKKLDLTNNNITSIQENAFSSLSKLRELLLNTSSLLCDCKLKWLPAWLEKATHHSSVIAICAYPNWLKGKSVMQVLPGNFTCDDFPNPRIIEDPRTQVALKGGNATLHCKAVSSSQVKMTIQWKKDNMDWHGGNITNFARSPNGKGTEQDSVLFFSNISDSDMGTYQCVVSNDYGTTYSHKARISVLIFPTFVKTPGNVTVKTQDTARLECAAKGQPSPSIAWQKDGGNDFPAAKERRMHVMPTDDVFFIVNVKTSDMGTYSCTAQNPAGVIVANASLTVEEPPSFVKRMENKEITAGETIVLECMASGSPKPKLTWRKDGKDLVIMKRHFFTADDQLLVIVDTDLSDAGTYECQISNSLGTVQGFSQLSVIPASTPSMNESDMTGIIIITVVCCAVGTSIVWVVIIYQTRKRMGIVEVRGEKCSYPNTLLAASTAPDNRESAPHLYLDTNSEHSSGSKDSGTGDSAGKRSSDNLLLSNVHNLADGGNHSMEGANHVVLGEMSSTLDAITTSPVLRSNFHPRRTNHDRCYVGACGGSSKRWSDPDGMEKPVGPLHSQTNSYYSLPKNLHPTSHLEEGKMMAEDEADELVPCIPVTCVQ